MFRTQSKSKSDNQYAVDPQDICFYKDFSTFEEKRKENDPECHMIILPHIHVSRLQVTFM
jgi:hypothetical protein